MILVLRTSLVAIARYLLLHHLFERRYRFTKSPEPTGPEPETKTEKLVIGWIPWNR
jgi:hypothetical protein